MNNWKDSKEWSDKFIPEIKRHLGMLLISEAPIEEDQEHNTDLIVLTLNSIRVACRIRDHSYEGKWGNEFTMRTGRPSGVRTELTKVIEGWGNYQFYGFGNDSFQLTRWSLLDLNVFRLAHSRALAAGKPLGVAKLNKDGSSTFAAFKIAEFPKELVLGSSHN